MNHIIQAHSPLGAETLRFRTLRGTEGVSQLFEWHVELVADTPSLNLKQLLGQPLTLQIETAGGGTRYLDGLVARAALVAREGGVGRGTAREWRYRATVRPWLWLLTRTRDCKIFQRQSVPDILQSVLAEYGFPVANRLTGSYRPWTYCVQYQETDFDFVSRLMEHEGIYYYFEHALGSHTLVLADDIGTHPPLPGDASMPFFEAERFASPDRETVDVFQVAEQIVPGAYVVDDYNFSTPRASLRNQRAGAAGHPHGDMEIYDWMGGYGDPGESDHYSRVRLEQLQSERERAHGHAWSRSLAPGYCFDLRGSPRDEANRRYLLVSVRYHFEDAGYASGGDRDGNLELARYECDFVCQPTTLPFRSPRVTPWPRSRGPQTAVVVGPAGEPVWTDEYGRVKVQFRWDREGGNDENSSCWLRVASSSAGSGMGSLNIPRVGQEVVIDFINGQLDRPIVMGCTYNAEMMPAHGLPANASRSLFVSRSLNGGPGQASSLMFEDKPGAEHLALHAEKDYSKTAENDKLTSVGNDHHERIGGNARQRVGANKSTSIGGDYDHQVDGASSRTVASSSTELHGSDYHHTTVGPSTVRREDAHSQTYLSTYEHHVSGPATSTWQGPHVLTHGATYEHSVGTDHHLTVGGNHGRDITGNHEHTVDGDHDLDIDGHHEQTVGGQSVHTVGGNHTLTAAADSHHVTPGTYSMMANSIHIGAGGGGGAPAGKDETDKNWALGTKKIDWKGFRVSITCAMAMDWTTLKASAIGVNFSFDGYKIAITGVNMTWGFVERKTLHLKAEVNGDKKGKPHYESSTGFVKADRRRHATIGAFLAFKKPP